MDAHRTAAKIFYKIAELIENGGLGLEDEELLAICETMARRKLNIEKVCQRYGITRATLNRWQQKGKLPPFHKDSGGKDYLFSDEADNYIARWTMAND